MTEIDPRSPRAATPEPVDHPAGEGGVELICALAGCETVIEQAARGHARRYCCTAHRKIARRHRRESANSAAGCQSGSPEPTAASEPGSGEFTTGGRPTPF